MESFVETGETTQDVCYNAFVLVFMNSSTDVNGCVEKRQNLVKINSNLFGHFSFDNYMYIIGKVLKFIF